MNKILSGFSLTLLALTTLALSSCSFGGHPKLGQIEIVAGLDFTPGNVSVSSDDRIFATKHALRPSSNGYNLTEILNETSYRSFPGEPWNRAGEIAIDRINASQGIIIDKKNRIWIVDHGNFIEKPAQPKLLVFDIATKNLEYRFLIPDAAAKVGSFIQDLAVDEDRGFAFLADMGGVGKPAIIVIDINNNKAWRYEGLKEFASEDIDMYVSNRVVTFPDATGKSAPARVGLNPITASADGETVFFGAMTGLSWYSVPAKVLREHKSLNEVQSQVKRVGPKPISDGACTDSRGIHYFTNLGSEAIDYLDNDGKLKRLVQDRRLQWSDSIRVGPDGWLYVATTQLDKAATLNEGKDDGKPPYLIFKIYSGSPGTIGK
jgi:sugar lactone lactonase YvrE